MLLSLGVITATLLSTTVWLTAPAALPASAQTATTCNGVAATIVGSPGNDDISGTSGRDVIATLGGDDKVRAQGGNDLICSGAGNDDIRGDAGTDNINGGTGFDDCRSETVTNCEKT